MAKENTEKILELLAVLPTIQEGQTVIQKSIADFKEDIEKMGSRIIGIEEQRASQRSEIDKLVANLMSWLSQR